MLDYKLKMEDEAKEEDISIAKVPSGVSERDLRSPIRER